MGHIQPGLLLFCLTVSQRTDEGESASLFFVFKTTLFFLFFLIAAIYLAFFEQKMMLRLLCCELSVRRGRFLHLFVQPFADIVKLLIKKNRFGDHSFRQVVSVAFLFGVSLMQFGIVPLSDSLFLLNPADGLLCVIFFHFLFCLAEILIKITADAKHEFFGVSKACISFFSSQLLFFLSIIAIYIKLKTFCLVDIVNSQVENSLIFLMPHIFVVFFIACLIATNRRPFDFGGTFAGEGRLGHIEYGGILFVLIYLAQYLHTIFVALIISTIFLGGYEPIFHRADFVPPCCWLCLKTIFIFFIMVLLPASLASYRQDQVTKVSIAILCPIVVLFIAYILNMDWYRFALN